MIRRLWSWLIGLLGRRSRRRAFRGEFPCLPDPFVVARVWSKLDPGTQHMIQKAYELCDCAECEREKAAYATVRANIMSDARSGTGAYDISESDASILG